MLAWNDLVDYLPYNLLKEVIYFSSRELLIPMFSKFASENLIRELGSVLDNVVYLPGDYIIHKDDIGNEMYFIVQGRVFVIAADKQTVLNTLG
jgi:CRP-like cAMP-binding protein